MEATTDPLTGLANRRGWDRAIGAELAALGAGRGLCVAMIDLDRLKSVNDTQGYAVGDRVLEVAAAALGRALRSTDFVARLGGDEFGLLLSVPDAGAAAAVLERVRRAVPAALAEAGLPVLTASAGYVVADADRAAAALPCPDKALAAAAEALHRAKRVGGDRTICAAE